MWKCPKCDRIFEKENQMHSCKKIPLEEHFKNNKNAKKIFNFLFKQINNKIGPCSIISLPCCIHLFGKYDFLAALPKKNKLEIRFSLNRELDSQRLTQSIPVSSKFFKNCIELSTTDEINKELLKWLDESYFLKENK